MKSPTLLSLILLIIFSIAQPTLAYETESGLVIPSTWDDFVDGFKGSNASLRYRNQHNNDGDQTKNLLQYKLYLTYQLTLTKDGRWQITAIGKTGGNYSSGWNDSTIGENADFNDDFAVRVLYAQYQPNANNTIQAGFLNSLTKINQGILGLDSNGWFDGVRWQRSNLGKWAEDVVISVGRVGDFDETGIEQRGFGSPNIIQVHIRGDINERLSYLAEGTTYDEGGMGDGTFLRSVLNVGVKDVVSFIDSVFVELAAQDSGDHVQGVALGATKNQDQWKWKMVYSDLDDEISQKGPEILPRNPWYRKRKQFSVFVSRPLKGYKNFHFFFRFGKTIEDNNFFDSEGLRAETGFNYFYQP